MNRAYYLQGVFKNIINNNNSKLLLLNIKYANMINLTSMHSTKIDGIQFYCDILNNINEKNTVHLIDPLEYIKNGNYHKLYNFEVFNNENYFEMFSNNTDIYTVNDFNHALFLVKDINKINECNKYYESEIMKNIAF